MLQKVMCGYTTPISQFKANPNGLLSEARGEAIAVSSNNRIQFYAVPAELFEEMAAFCEYTRGDSPALTSVPANFTGEGLDMDKVTMEMAAKIKNGDTGDYEEWS